MWGELYFVLGSNLLSYRHAPLDFGNPLFGGVKPSARVTGAIDKGAPTVDPGPIKGRGHEALN